MIELGYVPRLEVTTVTINGVAYTDADFLGAGLVETQQNLPEYLWKATDDDQLDYLDTLAGGQLNGYTWHHTTTPGVMQRVPFGVHNVYNHQGGRSAGLWADAPR